MNRLKKLLLNNILILCFALISKAQDKNCIVGYYIDSIPNRYEYCYLKIDSDNTFTYQSTSGKNYRVNHGTWRFWRKRIVFTDKKGYDVFSRKIKIKNNIVYLVSKKNPPFIKVNRELPIKEKSEFEEKELIKIIWDKKPDKDSLSVPEKK